VVVKERKVRKTYARRFSVGCMFLQVVVASVLAVSALTKPLLTAALAAEPSRPPLLVRLLAWGASAWCLHGRVDWQRTRV
jgi:hypothetical protein